MTNSSTTITSRACLQGDSSVIRIGRLLFPQTRLDADTSTVEDIICAQAHVLSLMHAPIEINTLYDEAGTIHYTWEVVHMNNRVGGRNYTHAFRTFPPLHNLQVISRDAAVAVNKDVEAVREEVSRRSTKASEMDKIAFTLVSYAPMRWSDLDVLFDAKAWLNDTVISNYTTLLHIQYGKLVQCYFADSTPWLDDVFAIHDQYTTAEAVERYISPRIKRSGKRKPNMTPLQLWTEAGGTSRMCFVAHTNVVDRRKTLQWHPHISKTLGHWITLDVDPSRKTVDVYDSLDYEATSDPYINNKATLLSRFLKTLSDVLRSVHSENGELLARIPDFTSFIVTRKDEMPKQRDSCTCGVFALLAARQLALNQYAPHNTVASGTNASFRIDIPSTSVTDYRNTLARELLHQCVPSVFRQYRPSG